jgi:type I restriction enzyme S subunit
LDILKISAATRGEFFPSERKHFWDKPRFREEFDLRKGDVLMCRTNGTLAYVGMSALVEEDQENLIFPDKLIRVRAQDNIEPAYLWRVLQLPPLRAQIEAAARTAVGNYAIGTPDIWSLQIPQPPLAVQRAIVRRIAEARASIAREQETAARLARESEAEVEAMILGTGSVSAR